MPKPRHQDGWVELYEGPKGKKWVGHWYVYERDDIGTEIRRHKSRVLGFKSAMTKWQAQEELKRLILIATGGVGQTARADSRVAFGWFWRNRWLPLLEGTWKADTTRAINMLVLQSYIGRRWDTVALRDIAGPDVAAWLAELARDRSYSLVHKARTYMNAILAEAVEQDYLTKNPMRRVKMPRTRPVSAQFLTIEQVRAVSGQLDGVNQVMFHLFVLCGLRPGELFGLRAEDWRDGVLHIRQAVVRGRVVQTKTEDAAAPVAVPRDLSESLDRICPKSGYLFPSSTGTAINARNWFRRVLAPAAKRACVERINYQMLRRTWATLAHDAGVPLKLVQAQLRHASLNVTANVYTKVVTSSQKKAVEDVAQKIFFPLG